MWKTMKSLFSGHVDKIYTKDGTVHLSIPQMQRGKVWKIYHINNLGENYRENEQNDSIQSSYQFIL